jgi:integrase
MSDSSKKLYTHNLTKLNDNEPIVNLNFLKKTSDIIGKFPKNKNTARSYVIACVVACKERKGFKKCLEIYTKCMDELNLELKDATSKTEKYKENELTWDEILTARDALPKNSVEYVLLSLYTMLPPRRSLDYIAQIGKPQENSNFYDGTNFYFGNYKTKGSYNTQVVPVPTELKKVIDDYLEARPFKSTHLLIKKSGIPYKTRDIQLTLNKILKKKISSTMLRSIFLSSKYGNMMEEMKSDADAMGTSTSVIQSNYIKK